MLASINHSRHATHHRAVATKRPGVFARIASAIAARRQRQDLLRLDAAMLRDIGLTREQALAEAGRPIWDSPVHWRV